MSLLEYICIYAETCSTATGPDGRVTADFSPAIQVCGGLLRQCQTLTEGYEGLPFVYYVVGPPCDEAVIGPLAESEMLEGNRCVVTVEDLGALGSDGVEYLNADLLPDDCFVDR
ncbi:MAG: hypothetical protein HY763_15710 [Planctomycetes bacterium]|nr:hypothetical protein [Planctomycetota bacterium]